MKNAMQFKKLDSLMSSYIRSNALQCCVIRVSHNDQTIYEYDKGFGDRTGKPVGGNTIFQAASVTKPVIAAVLMLLQDEGKLDILDPVSLYHPAFQSRNRSEIRVVDLLTHTSGLMDHYPEEHVLLHIRDNYGIEVPDCVSMKDDKVNHMFNRLSELLDMPDLNRYGQDPLRVFQRLCHALSDSLAPLYRPGTRCDYCNYGYNVVSEIISQVAGERFDLYAHARLFAPLNMDSTFWQVPIERQNDLVKRYKPALAAAWFNSDQFMSRTTGCDGLKTTASDMLKFLQMLSRGGMDGGTPVLSPKSVECMTKNINKNLSLDSYFSAGFHLYDRFNAANGTKRSADSINHGGMGGAHILMDPQYGICAACFTVLNKDAAFHDFGAFYDALYECII